MTAMQSVFVGSFGDVGVDAAGNLISRTGVVKTVGDVALSLPQGLTTPTLTMDTTVLTVTGAELNELDRSATVVLFDDFLGPVLDSSKWAVTKGSDGACANFAIAAAVNGVITATFGADAGATMALNGVQIHSALNWKPNQGGLSFACRVKVSAITAIAVFVGLTDQVAALEAPVTSAASADTITTNATDGVGVMFDTSMATDTWWLVGVKADVDATKQDTTLAPTADTFEDWRVDVTSAGVATFYRNDVAVGTAMSAATTATVALTPVVAAFRRSAGGGTISVDKIRTVANRV